MTDRLFENTTLLKILSVIVAIFIWFQAQPKTQPINRTLNNVAVGYPSINPHLAVTAINPSTVNVTINGNPGTVSSNSVSGDVSAFVNLSHITNPGTYLLKVSSSVPQGVTFVNTNPVRVEVFLAKMGQRKLPVTVNISGQPTVGNELVKYVPSQTRVTISGPSSALKQVHAVVGTLVVTGRAATFSASVVLHAVNAQGQTVPKIEINPPTTRVTASIQSKPPEKVLPIIGQVTGTPASGYTVSQITVYPSSVTLTGKKSLLNTLNHIYTKPVDVNGATKTMLLTEPVLLPKGAKLVTTGHVTVTITITHSG